MEELIRSIPGVLFLIIWWLVLIFVSYRLRVTLHHFYPDQYRRPAPKTIDSYDTAMLRGGISAVLHVCLFELIQRKLIEIYHEGEKIAIKVITPNNIEEESQLKSPTLEMFDTLKIKMNPDEPLEVRRLFRETTKSVHFQDWQERAEQKLTKLKFFISAWDKFSAIMKLLFFVFLWDIFACIKIAIGAEHHKSIGFLLISIIIGSIISFIILSPLKKLSPYAKKYLEEQQQSLEWVSAKMKQGDTTIDPVMAIAGFAVFGTSILATSALYQDFSRDFPAWRESTSGCGGSGCSSGCSGCSSGSDGGSSGCSGSDGGGSGCSGGCGGCGGGGD